MTTKAKARSAADLARCTATANAMLTAGRSLVLPESLYDETIEPTDAQIIAAVSDEFDLTPSQAVARLRRLALVPA